MLKKLLVGILLASAAWAVNPTTVSDTLYEADGTTLFNGQLRIAWGTFISDGGQEHPAGYLTTNIVNGVLSQPLMPLSTATPTGSFYTVNYQLLSGQNITECWIVPDLFPSTANLIAVRMAGCGSTFPTAGGLPISLLTPPGAPNTFLNTNAFGKVGWVSALTTFDLIGTGTNQNTALIVGNGSSLTTGGTGIINANQLSGNPVGTSGAAIPVLNVSNTFGGTQTFNNITISGACSGCSSATFGTIAGGTNTTAAMIVSTGASLTYSGSGTINATTLNGDPTGTSGATIPVLSASNTFSGTQTFNNITVTGTCTGCASGAFAFGSITTGSNTTATMTVGTGGTITYSGSGVVNASTLNGDPTGTSGTTIPVLSASNTFGGTQTFNNLTVTGTCTGCGTSNPGGTNKMVQFNNSGAFGGDANFEWDNINKRVAIGNTSPTASLTVGAAGLVGSAQSTLASFYGGSLSSTAGTDIILSSFGVADVNQHSLGIHAHRVTSGSSWVNTELWMSFDVDNTPGISVLALGNGYTKSYNEFLVGTTDSGSGAVLQISSYMQMISTAQPPCDATHRFVFWSGSIGGVDVVGVCTFDGASYGWRSLI